ncbi:MAG: hypothetical protein JO283_05115 [Bradyrhizobium sp.]|nr:hypothetical protein [Bradyrhizobium sp.]
MKTIYFASVCGATLLAVTSLANAQGTGISSNPDQGVTSKQCWDVSSNIIREKNPTDSSSEKTPKTTVGSTASGATGSSNSSGSTGTASARPAGMPDC